MCFKMELFYCLSVILLTIYTEALPLPLQENTEYRCSFEDSDPSCFLEQDNDDLNWKKVVDATEVEVDSVLNVKSYSGHNHMYVDNTNLTGLPSYKQNYTARFISNINFASTENCLTLFYYMYGCDTGDFKVKVERSNPDAEIVFEKSGSQQNMWHKAVIPLTMENNMKIIIEAVLTGNGTEAIIAIDEVSLNTTVCSSTPVSSNNQETSTMDEVSLTTTVPNVDGGYSDWSEFGECSVLCNGGIQTRTRTCTNPPPSGTGKDCQGPSTEHRICNTEDCLCTFEEEDPYCWLVQDLEDDFNWRYYWNSTPSKRTGPTAAKNGQRFAYIEASPREIADSARLKSSIPLSSTKKCMSMYYHMYGEHIGDLRVKVVTEGQHRYSTVFYKGGNKGNQWLYTAFEIPSGENLEILIEGVRGYGVFGDIALDDVKLLEGGCA